MPLSGLKFKKETNPLSRRIQRLFERTRADYLSAKQEPKTYTKDWMKAFERLQNIYAGTDEFTSSLKEVLSEDMLERDDAKDPKSTTAAKIYSAIKDLRFDSENVRDPFSKEFRKNVLEELLENKGVLMSFIHWALRSDRNALPREFWDKYLPKGDKITDGYDGLDLHFKDIGTYIIEHYGDEKNTNGVKAKVKASMSLFKDLYTAFYSQSEWDSLVGLDIEKSEKEKGDINFMIPNKPMYRIFEVDDIKELRGFTGDWLVQEKYDGMRIQLHKIDGKVKIYSYNGNDITDKCKDQVKILGEKKFGECILDGELMLFEKNKPLHRAQVIAHVFKDKHTEGELRIHVFDIMRHNDRDLADTPLQDRINILFQNYSVHSDEKLQFPSKKDTRIADSLEEINRYGKEIMKIPTSEGVVIKDLTSTYIKGAKKNPKWIKWKKFVDLDLIVLDKKSTKSNLNSYTLGAGPLSLEEARKLQSEKINDRYYLNVGKALNTKIDVEVGKIVRVKVDEVKVNSKGQYRVFTAKVIEIPEVEAPDKLITLQLLADTSGDTKKYKAKALEKGYSITDDIHGETEVILKFDMDGFTIYGFGSDNLMAKNAIVDLDLVKEEMVKLLKDKTGIINSAVIQILKDKDKEMELEEIVDDLVKYHPKAAKTFNEVYGKNIRKFALDLKNKFEGVISLDNRQYGLLDKDKLLDLPFEADENIVRKEYKTPEEYRKGDFKVYLRKDGNVNLTFKLADETIGWEIQIDSVDDIFDLFGKSGKYPAKVQETVSKEKLIDEGEVELGVQRHGYHEYILKGEKFDTKLHVRVVPLKDQKQWIAFSSFVKEPVEPSTDDGIWDIREDDNKDLSFDTLD